MNQRFESGLPASLGLSQILLKKQEIVGLFHREESVQFVDGPRRRDSTKTSWNYGVQWLLSFHFTIQRSAAQAQITKQNAGIENFVVVGGSHWSNGKAFAKRSIGR
jgi:hypothetical protein